jgi:hypothetical protein
VKIKINKKVVKKLLQTSQMLIKICPNLFVVKGTGGKKEEEKYEGFPRPGGDLVAPAW